MPNWKKVLVSGSEAHLTSVTSSNGVQLADDAFLNLGDGNDLQLYHDGDNSYIKDAGTGGLFYRGGTQTFQNAAGSKSMVVLNAANSVDLNFNDSTKFQTTNTGVSVTGEVVATANVSSSLVSTGSFGDGRFASRLSVGTQESPSLYDAGANTMLVSNAGGNAGITIRSSTSGGGTLHFADGTSGNASYRGVIKYGHSDDDFTFFTAGSSRMKLDSSGVLKDMAGVSGSSTSTGSFGRVETDGDAEFGNNVTINGTNATIANATNPHLFLNDTNARAAIFQQSGNDTRIGSDSNTQVLLVQNNATAVTIDTNKDAFFVGNISGSVIRASGDIIAFNSSDERLKDNVTYIHKPIEKINQIGGYEFDWNEKQQVYHGHDVGVLAQELEKVLPEAVKDRDSGYKGVQYDKIIPLLIEGIKEQTEHIKDLKERIEKLEKLNKLF